MAAYAALTGLCNRTEIGSGRIWARHGPLPWAKGVALPTRDVVQVYTKAIQLGRRAGPITRVWLLKADGARLPLTARIFGDTDGIASYIERRVEEEAGVLNYPVVCPGCGYDLRVSKGRCPECGDAMRTTKRERRAWSQWLRGRS